jgi:hypothetical protein
MSPIQVCSNLQIATNTILTIEPGVTVGFADNVSIIVQNGGRLIAEGNETNRIHFTKAPGASRWGFIRVLGSTNSPETRITYADIDSHGSPGIWSSVGTVFLDHINFASTDRPSLALDGSSFVVSHCYFAKGTGNFEPAHGTGGIKPGGLGIFRRNFFAGAFGYNDLVDFTGGNRPDPIVHFINNVIANGQDDGLDIDGTDAWVEANIFLNIHRNNGTPDSAAGIAGGDFGSFVSRISIIGNLFFDCDNAATAKQGNFFALINNTIVHITKQGGVDLDAGPINVRDLTPSPTTFGQGDYVEANIIWDVPQLVRNYDPLQTIVTFNTNLLQITWSGPGAGNLIGDPLLKHVPTLAEATFSDWESAQILRDWFSLTESSPAIRASADGRDLGAILPMGVVISGVPSTVTSSRRATLQVGFNRTDFGIPTAGWPEGVGYTHYKWRLDGGEWSAEKSIHDPIELLLLSDGPHRVEAVGRRDSGLWQDDPILGEDATISSTPTWTVQAGPIPEFSSIARSNNEIQLTFIPQAGQSYTLLSRESFDEAHPWAPLETIPSQQTSAPFTISVPIANDSRFFQLVTP